MTEEEFNVFSDLRREHRELTMMSFYLLIKTVGYCPTTGPQLYRDTLKQVSGNTEYIKKVPCCAKYLPEAMMGKWETLSFESRLVAYLLAKEAYLAYGC